MPRVQPKKEKRKVVLVCVEKVAKVEGVGEWMDWGSGLAGVSFYI